MVITLNVYYFSFDTKKTSYLELELGQKNILV